MDSSPGPDAAAPDPGDLFAAWLASDAASDAAGLERLCGLHPEHAGRFRAWWAQLDAIGELDAPAAGVDPAEAETLDGTAPAAAREADRLGPYRLERELGRGAQGIVWLASDTRDGTRVALKVLPPHVVGARGRTARFRREAELASRVRHDGIGRVLDTGSVEGCVYLAMEFVEGRTLADWIAEAAGATREHAPTAPPPLDGSADAPADPVLGVVRFFERAAEALHAAHETGLIHRDIKPGNLMVRSDGAPVLLDFGLARDTDDDTSGLTMTGDLLGTPAYMSPEQIAAQRIPLDRRTDVYSLGATLYEALTLQRPFDAPTMDRLFQAILSSDPPPVDRIAPQVPRDVAVVVETCLDKDRNRRYATAADLAEDLRRVRTRQTIRARRAGPGLRLRRWVRRNPIATALVATLVAATALVSWSALVANTAVRRYELINTIPLLERAERALRPGAASGDHPPWPAFREAMAGLDREHAPRLFAQRARLGAALAAIGDRPRSDAEAGLREVLGRFVEEDLTPFLGDEARHGIAWLRERIAWADVVRARSIGRYGEAWRRAAAAVAADARYAGTGLTPQLGLVPLGTNPRTGLVEFLHLRSTAPEWSTPERLDALVEDPPRAIDGPDATGGIVPRPGLGIVFVLVPPGRLPSGEEVEAFFVGAHEVTKAQWQRLARRANDGAYDLGSKFGERNPVVVDGRFPAERETLATCRIVLRENGLDVPTVAQWEYAARAGDTGPAPDLGDGDQHLGETPAPVGGGRPNAFGLFDLFGNVFEWCVDPALGTAGSAIRGGSHRNGGLPYAVDAYFPANERNGETGVRAVRPLVPGR